MAKKKEINPWLLGGAAFIATFLIFGAGMGVGANPQRTAPVSRGSSGGGSSRSRSSMPQYNLSTIAAEGVYRVYFNVGSSAIEGSALEGIQRAVTELQNRQVRVYGYASSDGDTERNIALASARSAAVADFLTVHQVRVLKETGLGPTETEGEPAFNRVAVIVAE